VRLVVADTGPLNYLVQIGASGILAELVNADGRDKRESNIT